MYERDPIPFGPGPYDFFISLGRISQRQTKGLKVRLPPNKCAAASASNPLRLSDSRVMMRLEGFREMELPTRK